MLLDKVGEPYATIRQQLAHATVAKREFTGVGFFTEFALPADAPVRHDLADLVIDDVGVEFPSLQHGAGFVLFIRGGAVSMLEGFTYDEAWPTNTDKFTLIRLQKNSPALI